MILGILKSVPTGLLLTVQRPNTPPEVKLIPASQIQWWKDEFVQPRVPNKEGR